MPELADNELLWSSNLFVPLNPQPSPPLDGTLFIHGSTTLPLVGRIVTQELKPLAQAVRLEVNTSNASVNSQLNKVFTANWSFPDMSNTPSEQDFQWKRANDAKSNKYVWESHSVQPPSGNTGLLEHLHDGKSFGWSRHRISGIESKIR